ncbi:MAG: hypothetical protein AB4080_14445 [Trichodesmium sp.]
MWGVWGDKEAKDETFFYTESSGFDMRSVGRCSIGGRREYFLPIY